VVALSGVVIMTIPKKPRLDAWYEDEEGRCFKIVAIDDDDGAIGIQYFDGDVAEVENDTWYQMGLKSIEEPENGSGPFDDMGGDDKSEMYRAIRPEDWNGPADEMDFEE